MTDPRSIQPPAPSAPSSPLSTRGEAKATILDIAAPLKSLPRPVRINGVIAGRNDNGSVTINTDQGPIIAIVRSPQPITQGQHVEIDIQPGNPPRQATIRPADASVPQNTDATIPSTPDAPQPAPAPSSQEAGLQQPVTVAQSRLLPPEQAPATPPPSFPLPPDQPVRLLPLPPGEEIFPAPPGQPLEETLTQLPQQVLQAALQPVLSALPTTALQDLLQSLRALQQPLTATPVSPQASPPILQSGQATPQNPLFLLNMHATGTNTAHTEYYPIKILIAGAMNRAQFFTNPSGKTSVPLFQNLTAPAKLGLEPLSPHLLSEEPPATPGVLPPAIFPRFARLDARTINIIPDAGRLLTANGKPIAQSLPQLPAGFAGELDATVEGFTRQGLPVLSIALPGSSLPQSFILQFSASNLDPGAHVMFLPQPDTSGTDSAMQAAAPGIPQETQWPALQQLANILRQIAPQAAQTLAQILPGPAQPEQLPAAALLFIATVQSGDLNSWLGDKTVDLLRKSGKTDLISRLTQDLDTAGRSASEPVAQDWKPVPMPLYYDGQMQRMTLWVRQDGGNGKDTKDKTRQTRFLFDLNLNRMGAVQLDGLAKQKRVDLIVRTVKPVSGSMKQIMRRKYLNALEQAAFTGELSFQDRPDQFIKIDNRKTGQTLNI